MDCKEARSLLDAFIDDELGAERSHAVDRHLGACPRCAAEASSLRALDAGVREAARACDGASAGPIEAGAALRERLRRALDAEPAAPARPPAAASSLEVAPSLGAGEVIGPRAVSPGAPVRLRRRALVAAAAIVVLAVLGTVISQLTSPPVAYAFATEHVAAAADAATCPRALLSPEATLALCRERVSRLALAPSLEAAGFALRGGEEVVIEGERYIRLCYGAPDGARASVFVRRRLGGAEAALPRGCWCERAGGCEVVRVRCPGGNTYVLVVEAARADRAREALTAQLHVQ
jgi:anti-sigma factor RsiW